jgi:ABC-2 type transport system ATP-binding protein
MHARAHARIRPLEPLPRRAPATRWTDTLETHAHSDAVIEIRDLAKSYGRKASAVSALDGVSLTVRKGEVFGLLGRNGAGKTTLVRTLLGLLRPQAGTVRLFGRDPSDLEMHARVGFSPEEPGFPRYLYPRQVLEYCGALSGLRGTALTQAVERELTRSELQEAANRQARQLSKGMKQRLSLAQAFLHQPELLILDEPTADLDPIGRRQVRDMIVEFRERGGTVLLNSHLLSEVERVCDRVGVIHGGRLLREGPVDELMGEGQELEDFFVELVQSAGGGAGYAPQWSDQWAAQQQQQQHALQQAQSPPQAPPPAPTVAPVPPWEAQPPAPATGPSSSDPPTTPPTGGA